MIIVTGSITSQPEHAAQVERLCLDHVHWSRQEPGCLLHSVHRDVEDSLRFVFIEQWADRDALAAHFAVSASFEFVGTATALASVGPTIEIYEATETRV